MKRLSKGCVILGILFVLVSIIAFAVPTLKTVTFWVAYGFTVAAFIGQIVIWKTALGKAKTPDRTFLGLPIVCIGIGYGVVQGIAFAIFLFVPTLPTWSAVVVCSIIAGVSMVCMVAASVARKEIERVGANANENLRR